MQLGRELFRIAHLFHFGEHQTYFLIMNRECRSRMRDLAEKKYGKVANGDVKPNSWTLLDFGEFLLALLSCL